MDILWTTVEYTKILAFESVHCYVGDVFLFTIVCEELKSRINCTYSPGDVCSSVYNSLTFNWIKMIIKTGCY